MIDVKEIGVLTNSSVHWKEKQCFICGKYFDENDKLVIIIATSNMRHLFPNNKVAHYDEVKDLCDKVSSKEEFFTILKSHKTPKIALTKEQEDRINVFINAAYNMGYHSHTKKKDGTVVCKENGTSDTVTYNVHSDIISYHNRRKRQLFDSFVHNQKQVNVYNEFHRLLNDGKHDDYNALKSFSECMNKVVETTNNIMGK